MKQTQHFVSVAGKSSFALLFAVMMVLLGTPVFGRAARDAATAAAPAATPLQRGGAAFFPRGELITNPFFQGDTWLYMLVHPASPHYTGIGNVTFSPGARNNWHSHDVAQFLLALPE